MEAWAIVVAGGSGTRFGRPKQYAVLGGRPRPRLGPRRGPGRVPGRGGRAAAPSDPPALGRSADAVVAGGATRSDSVRAGLAAVPAGAEVIVVHDAARPLASAALWSAVLDAVAAGADAAIPAVPVTDTIKRVADGAGGRDRRPQRAGRGADPAGVPGRGPARRPRRRRRRHRRRRAGRGGRRPGGHGAG